MRHLLVALLGLCVYLGVVPPAHALNCPTVTADCPPINAHGGKIDGATITNGTQTGADVSGNDVTPTGGASLLNSLASLFGNIVNPNNYALPKTTFAAGIAPSAFFVRTGGNDANDCLAATQGAGTHGPCASVQRAGNALMLMDNRGFVDGLTKPTIDVGAGTFTGGLFILGSYRGNAGGAAPGNPITISGAGSGSTTIDDTTACGTIIVGSNAQIFYTGLKITKSAGCGGGGADVFVERGATAIQGQDVILGTAGNRIHVEALANWETAYSYTIDGAAHHTWDASFGGYIQHDPVGTITITCTGSADDSTSFAQALSGSLIQAESITFASCGTMTNAQFQIQGNAYFDVTGTTLPGTTTNNLIESGAKIVPDTAPTATGCTGVGAAGTCTLTTGSGNYSGIVVLTTDSSGTSNAGTITLTFNAQMGANNRVCSFTPRHGGAAWAQTATVVAGNNAKNTAIVTWQNAASALTVSQTYQMNYQCSGVGG